MEPTVARKIKKQIYIERNVKVLSDKSFVNFKKKIITIVYKYLK